MRPLLVFDALLFPLQLWRLLLHRLDVWFRQLLSSAVRPRLWLWSGLLPPQTPTEAARQTADCTVMVFDAGAAENK
jgi:hypothetical protein